MSGNFFIGFVIGFVIVQSSIIAWSFLRARRRLPKMYSIPSNPPITEKEREKIMKDFISKMSNQTAVEPEIADIIRKRYRDLFEQNRDPSQEDSK